MLGAPGRPWAAHIVQFRTVGTNRVAGQLTPEDGKDAADGRKRAGEQRNRGTRDGQNSATHVDRSGILARTIGDAAKVLDALKDPAQGYYDPRDPFTTVPRSSVLDSYARHTRAADSLKGLRIGVIRESMTVRPGNLTEAPITTAAAQEIKSVLGGKLAATLVESSDPLWKRDPDIEQMTVDYPVALARLVPVFMAHILRIRFVPIQRSLSLLPAHLRKTSTKSLLPAHLRRTSTNSVPGRFRFCA